MAIPDIQWEDHVYGNEVTVLAGQHRLKAVESAWPILLAKLRLAEKDVKKLQTKIHRAEEDSDSDEDELTRLKNSLKTAQDVMKEMRPIVDLVQRWPVELYDEGETTRCIKISTYNTK